MFSHSFLFIGGSSYTFPTLVRSVFLPLDLALFELLNVLLLLILLCPVENNIIQSDRF